MQKREKERTTSRALKAREKIHADAPSGNLVGASYIYIGGEENTYIGGRSPEPREADCIWPPLGCTLEIYASLRVRTRARVFPPAYLKISLSVYMRVCRFLRYTTGQRRVGIYTRQQRCGRYVLTERFKREIRLSSAC